MRHKLPVRVEATMVVTWDDTDYLRKPTQKQQLKFLREDITYHLKWMEMYATHIKVTVTENHGDK